MVLQRCPRRPARRARKRRTTTRRARARRATRSAPSPSTWSRRRPRAASTRSSAAGAGATQGGWMDASTILKPAIASGELRCIGATTYQDYKSHFERDRALARRFQRIEVSEPSVEDTHAILRGLKPHYEKHHGVTYTDRALRAAAELSAKHVNDRFLPDK